MPKSTTYEAKVPDEHGYIHYEPGEHAVWADLFAQQRAPIEQYCAKEYLSGFKEMDLPTDRIPSCPELSEKLTALTGWQVKPVPALIGFETFFELLANQTFPAASFIRRREDFDYIEEPDIFHEVFGHTPLLCDSRFADFSKAIGVAGCTAEREDYAWLMRLYWFTIEFGLIVENDHIKALGSGLASSPAELIQSTTSAEPVRQPFDVIDILRTPYRIDIMQPVYFLMDSADNLFDAAQRDLLADVKQAKRLGLHPARYPLSRKSA